MSTGVRLVWRRLTEYKATREVFNCLYVLRNPKAADPSRPFYVGKAKRLGGTSRARYNPGYAYLLDGLLEAGFELYAASLEPALFAHAVHYEEFLIYTWNPVANKRRGRYAPVAVDPTRPWQ